MLITPQFNPFTPIVRQSYDPDSRPPQVSQPNHRTTTSPAPMFGASARPKPTIVVGSEDEKRIRQFFSVMGMSPTDRRVSEFVSFVTALAAEESNRKPLNDMQNIMHLWVHDRSRPDKMKTGGTIATVQDHDGVRRPNLGILMTVGGADDIRREVVVFPHLALDSSNHTRATQMDLLGKIGEITFKDINAIDDQVVLDKPGSYLNVESIPYYFNFPRAYGPGIAITHGTDTLDENASLSAYMMLPKVLVWTGSFSSPGEPGSDATENIDKARLLAANSLTPIGSYVVIGNEIHLATRLKKINTHPWEAKSKVPYGITSNSPNRKPGDVKSYFASVDDKPIGFFGDNNEIYFSTEFLKEWQKILESRNLPPTNGLVPVKDFYPGYVEHIVMDENTPRQVFDDLVKRLSERKKARGTGAIIEGNIQNRTDFADIKQKIQSLAEENIYIVLESDARRYGLVSSYIPPSQLRTKLSALIGRESKTGLFSAANLWRDLAGEVIPTNGSKRVGLGPITIPKAFHEVGELIVAFPGMTPDIINDAVARLLAKPMPEGKRPILLINGFGDGHIPIGARTMEQRLKDGFEKLGLEDKGRQLVQRIDAEGQASGTESVYSIPNILKHLAEMERCDEQQARTLLRQAFIKSYPTLESVGNALDLGVSVLMGTKADFATPNLNAYEIGTILSFIGVKGLDVPTREYLKRFNTPVQAMSA